MARQLSTDRFRMISYPYLIRSGYEFKISRVYCLNVKSLIAYLTMGFAAVSMSLIGKKKLVVIGECDCS